LQSGYLEQVNNKLNRPAHTFPAGLPAGFASQFARSGDEKPMYRGELKALNAAVGSALAKATDRETKAHLEGARDQIAKILDPKFAAASPGATGGIRIGFAGELDPFLTPADQLGTCWPDYIILS
jgi:hypothetical protein